MNAAPAPIRGGSDKTLYKREVANENDFPRRILAAILLLALLLTALPIGVLAAELSFTDVPKNEWYYEDVRLAVEGGLVNGKSPTIYAPNDNVTYAETVKLAACIHKLTDTGSTEFAAGTVWYQPYVDYARSKQIISRTTTGTRRQRARISWTSFHAPFPPIRR